MKTMMMNKNRFARLGILATCGFLVVGCSVGEAPAGASQDEMRSTFEKQPVDERAKMLLEAPGPMDENKVSKIREMYKKEGKSVPDEIEKRLGGSKSGH